MTIKGIKMKFNEKVRQILEKTKLYHATYEALLPEIKKNGLDPNTKKKMWNDSKNVIYLSNDPWVAESYAETSEEVDEDWLDEIVILEMPMSKLDSSKLSKDKNVKNCDATFEYNKVIPWKDMKIFINK